MTDKLISLQVAVDAIARVAREKFNLSDEFNHYLAGLMDCEKAVRDLPEAVIRCKDCKHRYVDGDGARYNVCDLNHNKVQSDDWFCADAERKDGEADDR